MSTSHEQGSPPSTRAPRDPGPCLARAAFDFNSSHTSRPAREQAVGNVVVTKARTMADKRTAKRQQKGSKKKNEPAGDAAVQTIENPAIRRPKPERVSFQCAWPSARVPRIRETCHMPPSPRPPVPHPLPLYHSPSPITAYCESHIARRTWSGMKRSCTGEEQRRGAAYSERAHRDTAVRFAAGSYSWCWTRSVARWDRGRARRSGTVAEARVVGWVWRDRAKARSRRQDDNTGLESRCPSSRKPRTSRSHIALAKVYGGTLRFEGLTGSQDPPFPPPPHLEPWPPFEDTGYKHRPLPYGRLVPASPLPEDCTKASHRHRRLPIVKARVCSGSSLGTDNNGAT